MKPRHLPFLILLLLAAAACRKADLAPDRVAYRDQAFTNYFRRTSGWIAGDGAYSIPLSTGQSLWTFGDSYLDSYNPTTGMVPCLFQVRNAALIMGISDPTAQQTLPGNGGSNNYFDPGSTPGGFIWPGTGFQRGDTVCCFVTKYGGPIDSSFIAKILLPDFTLLGYTLRPDRNGIEFTNSLIDAGGYTYIYGMKSNSFGNDLFVARYAAGNIEATWEYFGQKGWDTDITKIKRIWDEFTSSFYICKIQEKYILITTEFSVGCDQGHHIYAASSDSPEGPFRNQHVVWALDDTLEGHYPFFYLANAHPEYDNGNDELLITYCINTYEGCVETCFNGRMYPDVYRPKAIRVPYELLWE